MGKIRNPRSFSEQFHIPPGRLEALRVLNPVLNVDTKLFIDPVLLESSSTPEVAQGAAPHFRGYFEDVITLLRATRQRGDVAWREAESRLRFPENAATCLGYGAGSIRGRGFGAQLRGRLIATAKEIVDLGVTDPDLFILLPLLEEGVGPDLISDLTTRVIAPDLARLTHRIATDLHVPTEAFVIEGSEFQLPVNPRQTRRTPVLLVPTDILRSLPLASDWSEVADAAAEIDIIRSRVNKLFGNIWSARARKDKKRLREAAIASKRAFGALLRLIHEGKITPYNIRSDPEGILVWRDVHAAVARDHPFTVPATGPPGPSKAIGVVQAIVAQFQRLVERKGLWKVLWHGLRPHKEKVSQMVFFAVADAYCKANNLDVTPEADTATGPIDFKFAASYRTRVLVEVKLSNSQRLLAGYRKQLSTYVAAEEPVSATYLVVDVGGMTNATRKKLLTLGAQQPNAPHIIFVPRWTLQNRPFVDGAKPAISGRPRPVNVYLVASSWRKSEWTLVRQLRGPHRRTCA